LEAQRIYLKNSQWKNDKPSKKRTDGRTLKQLKALPSGLNDCKVFTSTLAYLAG